MALHKFGFYGTKAKYAITLAYLGGCINRPSYQIVVATRKRRRWEGDIIEQLGTFDPIPNRFNEKLVALNFDRIRYWLGRDETVVSVSALELLGYSGLLPIHPTTYVRARKTRQFLEEFEKSRQTQLESKNENTAEKSTPVEADQSQKKEALG